MPLISGSGRLHPGAAPVGSCPELLIAAKANRGAVAGGVERVYFGDTTFEALCDPGRSQLLQLLTDPVST